MKFTITMKDPDGFGDSVDDAIKEAVADIADDDEREGIAEVRGEKIRSLLQKWFEYAEYVEIEIDTEAETATIVAQT